MTYDVLQLYFDLSQFSITEAIGLKAGLILVSNQLSSLINLCFPLQSFPQQIL